MAQPIQGGGLGANQQMLMQFWEIQQQQRMQQMHQQQMGIQQQMQSQLPPSQQPPQQQQQSGMEPPDLAMQQQMLLQELQRKMATPGGMTGGGGDGGGDGGDCNGAIGAVAKSAGSNPPQSLMQGKDHDREASGNGGDSHGGSWGQSDSNGGSWGQGDSRGGSWGQGGGGSWGQGDSHGGSWGQDKDSSREQSGGGDHGTNGSGGSRSGGAQEPAQGQIANNQEVKVADSSGRPLAEIPRFATWESVPFPAAVLDVIKKAGFASPSQIQQYTWPLALQGKDVIGVAATGSGKTLSFLLPTFAFIYERQVRPGDPVLLCIAPTRELAVQIQEECDKFGRTSGIKSVCCYGGAPKGPQASDIRNGVHGVIGTPGRINDFLEGSQLKLDKVCKLVLDEADRMLDMGFEPQIRKILQTVPRQRNTMFFTATWPPSVRRLASEFLNSPITVTIGNRDVLTGNKDITQKIMTCTTYGKNNLLMQVLQQAGVADRNNANAKGLVFCSTKRMCDQLASQLDRNGVPCGAVHGDKDQRAREAALNALKAGQSKLLVATDVAARGLDIKGVTLVVNFDAPSGTEDYVHRIGRTGRAGMKGEAVTLICERDSHALKGIIEVMKRTNQEVSKEIEEMARNAPPPPPPIRRGNRDGGKGGSFGSSFGSSFGGGGGSFVAGLSSGGGGSAAGPPGGGDERGSRAERSDRDRRDRDRSRSRRRDRSRSRRRRDRSKSRSRHRRRRSRS